MNGEFAKRAFDFTVALVTLLMVWPLILVIAALIKLDTKGPVFYRQERAGKDGEPFRIFKFRTMIVGAFRSGARLTVRRDPRITTFGQVLRWTKVDELPQFINVLLGDMSLVGPRPEDPYFTNFYTDEQRQVLSVRPGIIGPSQVDGRDEVEKYPEGVENVEEYYIKHILPEKLVCDLEYVRTATFWGDARFLVTGFIHVLLSQVKTGFLTRSRNRIATLGLDLLLMVFSYIMANLIKFDWHLNAEQWYYIRWTLVWVVILKPPIFIYYGLYQRSIRWVGRRDVAAIVKSVSVSSALVVAVTYLTGLQSHSRAVFIVDWAVLIFSVAAARYALGHVRRTDARGAGSRPYVKVLVAGSSHGGETILRSLLEDPNSRFMPVGIIDHEPHRWGALIHGVRVMGGATDIAMAASTHGVEMVLVSLADLDPVVVREITDACQKLTMEYRLVPPLSDMISEPSGKPIKRVSLSPEGSL